MIYKLAVPLTRLLSQRKADLVARFPSDEQPGALPSQAVSAPVWLYRDRPPEVPAGGVEDAQGFRPTRDRRCRCWRLMYALLGFQRDRWRFIRMTYCRK
jgi:hypothetical protein